MPCSKKLFIKWLPVKQEIGTWEVSLHIKMLWTFCEQTTVQKNNNWIYHCKSVICPSVHVLFASKLINYPAKPACEITQEKDKEADLTRNEIVVALVRPV